MARKLHQSWAPVRTPPQRQRVEHGERPPSVDFASMIGSLPSLDLALDIWDRLIEGPRMRLIERPRILSIPDWAEQYATHALRVAVFRYRPDVGAEVVEQIRANLARFGVPGVLVELGYFYEPAAVGHRSVHSRWSVEWSARHVERMRDARPARLPSGVLGAKWATGWRDRRRIVLIDTGDEGAQSQTAFNEIHCPDEVPVDHDGHGTSVGSLIRLVAPNATVLSFRVAEPSSAFAESSNLINAVGVATLSSGRFDMVCVPQRADLSVLTGGLQEGLKAVLAWNARGAGPMPVVVCAAGNRAPQPMAFPATIPGVVVAAGLDAAGRRALYNCPAPPGNTVHVVEAFGGIDDDPVGVLTGPGKAGHRLYGSSYATALVVGALAR